MEDRVGKRHEVTAVVGASNKSISIHMKATCVSEEKYIADSRNEDDYDSGNGEEAQEDEMEDNDASDDWNWDGCDDDSNIKTNLRGRIGHSASNDIRKGEKTAERAAKHTGRDDRATSEQVMDPRTRMIIFRMLNGGLLGKIDGCLSAGKEANVYYAIGSGKDEGREFAVKVYKTSILVFKDRDRYISGEHRYRKGYCRGNPRKMVKMWAEKEMRNLKRLSSAGIPCPEPITVNQNVLVMTFIGEEGWPSPRLRDANLSSRGFEKAYRECISYVRRMWRKCKLVHGDLSEYNLLYHRGRVFVIDVSQGMEENHPLSLDFLRMDCRNVNGFFKRKGCSVVALQTLFSYIISEKQGEQINDEDDDMALSLLLQNATLVEGASDELDDSVFMKSFIPRSLNDVEDCEDEDNVLRKGGREDVFIAAMEGMLAEGIGRKTTRFQKTESSTGYDSDSCISPKKEHAVSEEDSSTGIASDVSDDESPVEKWKSQSKGPGNYSTMMPEERELAKRERREKAKALKLEVANRRKHKAVADLDQSLYSKR